LAGLAAVDARDHIYTTDPTLLNSAKDYAQRAIAADPRNVEAHMWLGYVLLFQEEWEEGYREETRAMELDPSSFDAPYFAAGLFLVPRSRQEAERLCEQIIGEKDASDPHRRRRREGLRLFQRALELNPRHGWPWLAAGMVHMDLGNFRESRWCLEKAVELEKTPQRATAGVEGYLGECLRRAGQLAEAREHCMAGIEAIEKSDHFYRDTFRGVFLCSLGRTTLQQADTAAARAAFNQAALHLRGRSRARGGGHPFVQALCGLAQSDRVEAAFEEALEVFRRREGFDFKFFWCCMDDLTLLELARAAKSLGKTELARQLLDEAIDVGSVEALSEEMP
ncbi:MAG: tetratricopeptide repeat protein, partial [Planctomycetota bacterium]